MLGHPTTDTRPESRNTRESTRSRCGATRQIGRCHAAGPILRVKGLLIRRKTIGREESRHRHDSERSARLLPLLCGTIVSGSGSHRNGHGGHQSTDRTCASATRWSQGSTITRSRAAVARPPLKTIHSSPGAGACRPASEPGSDAKRRHTLYTGRSTFETSADAAGWRRARPPRRGVRGVSRVTKLE